MRLWPVAGCAAVWIALNCTTTHAQQKDVVAFGGLALASYGEDQESFIQSYPIAARLVLCGGRVRPNNIECNQIPDDFQSFVSDIFSNTSFEHFDLTYSMFGSNDIEGLVLVPVVSREAVLSADEGIGYSYSFRVYVDLMLLRFAPGEVLFVDSTPYILNYFDIKQNRLTEEEVNAIFLKLYTSSELGFNLFEELVAVSRSNLKDAGNDGNYAQVTGVEISDEVAAILEQSYSLDTWRRQVGQFFTANLVESTGASLLPSKLSSDITDRVNIVFSDANRRISIPTPNYEIKIDVERFVRHEQNSGSQQLICFIVAARLRVQDGFGEERSNIRFVRSRDSCGATDRGTLRADKMYFPESLFSLLTSVSIQLSGKIDRDFISSHVEDSTAAILALKELTTMAFQSEGRD